MQELAKLSIVHRDLAARNILLDKWFQAKVGDFGLAREGGEYSNARTKFPVRWTAPEALKFKKFTPERFDPNDRLLNNCSLISVLFFFFYSRFTFSTPFNYVLDFSTSFCRLFFSLFEM